MHQMSLLFPLEFIKGVFDNFEIQKMSETTYQKVFEVIRSSLVPNSQYDELQKEVACLKSELESVRNQWQSKFDEQKLAMDILQAEKESLESEKKAFENKFKEVSLKLKQKTHQYDSLLKSTETGHKETSIATLSAGTQTVKEEPREIGVVNVPTSSSSHADRPAVTTGTKRSNSNLEDDKRRTSKRMKSSKSDNGKRTTRKSVQTQRRFSCFECLIIWGYDIEQKFGSDPSQPGAPDPKKKVQTFTSFNDYRNHCVSAHAEDNAKYIENPCKETSCLLASDHSQNEFWPHGDIKCEICSLSFALQEDHDWHKRFGHADFSSMNNNDIYELYHAY